LSRIWAERSGAGNAVLIAVPVRREDAGQDVPYPAQVPHHSGALPVASTLPIFLFFSFVHPKVAGRLASFKNYPFFLKLTIQYLGSPS